MKHFALALMLVPTVWCTRSFAVARYEGRLLPADGFSFALDMPHVPSVYDLDFRQVVRDRLFVTLNQAVESPVHGLRPLLARLFSHEKFVLADPKFESRDFLPNAALDVAVRASDRILLYVVDGDDRVVADHPSHQIARQILAGMVRTGELVRVVENEGLDKPLRVSYRCTSSGVCR